MKVDFVIAGAQKGGTSALHAYLKPHPELCLSDKKELHFFDREELFGDGEPDYSVYHAAFHPKPPQRLLGEATPNYMFWKGAPERIRRYNPGMKLVMVLRNPVERAFSQWNMKRVKGAETLSFWDALMAEPERTKRDLPLQHKVHAYVARGFYADQLRRVWEFFPRNQTLVLRHELLRDDPARALGEITDFLGVAPFASVAAARVHAKPYESGMSAREKKFLQDAFRDEIKSLEALLGWDCSSWTA